MKELITRNPLAYFNFRGRFYEQCLDFDKAIFCFQNAIRFNDQEPDSLASLLYHLALLNFLQGNDSEAVKFARECLEIAPGHKIAEAVLELRNENYVSESDRIRAFFMRFENNPKIPMIQALRHSSEKLWEENERRFEMLQNIHQGDRAFIIGNGPSLSVSDLDHLKNEVTFASNKIYLAFDETDWRPTYYCVEDHLVMRFNHDRITRLRGFPKFFPFYLECCPLPDKESLIYFMAYDDFYPDRPDFSADFTQGLCWGATVTYALMQIAFFMGIRELYLIGMDFSFTVLSKENQEGLLVSKGEQNHFHPDYRPIGEPWNTPKLEYQERSFQVGREFFESHGGKIYNATRGGKLEIFPRVDFDSLF